MHKLNNTAPILNTGLFFKFVLYIAIFAVLSSCGYAMQTFKRIITPYSTAQVSEEVRQTKAMPEQTTSAVQERQGAPKPTHNTMPQASAVVAEKQIPPKPKKVSPPTQGSLSGKIAVLGKDKKTISSEGVILKLTRNDGKSIRSEVVPQNHSVDMEEKAYQPRYLSINSGDTLTFINKDEIKHNVFSSTGDNAFDLGTYEGGLERDVTLHESGLVKVYCNIHRNMAMFVSVDDISRSELATKDGHFNFEGLPEGDYELNIWHIRGQKTVALRIAANENTQLTEVLDTTNFKYKPHDNKYGKAYSSSNSLYGRKSRQGIDDELF